MRRNTIFDFMRENAFGYVGDNRKEMIEAKAAEIMKTGVKFKDACHVASAIYAKCEYFISTDARLLKYHTKEIKMVTPIEFVTEMEGGEQMMTSTAEIMNRGMKCLTEQMGIVEAEQFISIIIREKFDYTKWQRDYFDTKTPEEISAEASSFEKTQPFVSDAIRL